MSESIEKKLEQIRELIKEKKEREKEIRSLFDIVMSRVAEIIYTKTGNMDSFSVECTFYEFFRPPEIEGATWLYYNAVLSHFFTNEVSITFSKSIEYYNGEEENTIIYRVTRENDETYIDKMYTPSVEDIELIVENIDKIIDCWTEKLSNENKHLQEIKEKVEALRARLK